MLFRYVATGLVYVSKLIKIFMMNLMFFLLKIETFYDLYYSVLYSTVYYRTNQINKLQNNKDQY